MTFTVIMSIAKTSITWLFDPSVETSKEDAPMKLGASSFIDIVFSA